MKASQKKESFIETQTWEETSGLLEFLSSVPKTVNEFNERLGFGIESVGSPVREIDGDRDITRSVGFVLERKNPLLPEFRYCLYSVLKGKVLHASIGILNETDVRTVKPLQPLANFRQGTAVLHQWLTQLVRASCEKIML